MYAVVTDEGKREVTCDTAVRRIKSIPDCLRLSWKGKNFMHLGLHRELWFMGNSLNKIRFQNVRFYCSFVRFSQTTGSLWRAPTRSYLGLFIY